LQRMGVVPQGADAKAAPLLGAGMPPAVLAANLPLAQASRETSAPTDRARMPLARQIDTDAEEALQIAPDAPTLLGSKATPDRAMTTDVSEMSAQPSVAPTPAPDVVRSPSVPLPEVARSEAIARPAAPAIGEPPRAAPFSGAPISLTTLVLRRHA